MENEFSRIMALKSNEELYRIITFLKDEYQAEAVAAAEEELKKRNLDPDAWKEMAIRSQIHHRYHVVKATRRLPIIFRILAMLLPGAGLIILGLIFSNKGYDRLFRDLINFTFIGFAAWTAIFITLQYQLYELLFPIEFFKWLFSF